MDSTISEKPRLLGSSKQGNVGAGRKYGGIYVGLLFIMVLLFIVYKSEFDQSKNQRNFSRIAVLNIFRESKFTSRLIFLDALTSIICEFQAHKYQRLSKFVKNCRA